MTLQEFNNQYWRYYLMLEDEFFNTLNYVELIVNNFSTISMKYVNMLLSIGSEIDNFFKASCNLSGRMKISDYIDPLLTKYPMITTQNVLIKSNGIVLTPFSGWNTTSPSQSLAFWNNYNKVKHDRILNYTMASLENVINALAGLFILEMYMIKDIYINDLTLSQSIPDDESKIFVLKNWDVHLRTSNIKSDYRIFDDEDGTQIL